MALIDLASAEYASTDHARSVDGSRGRLAEAPLAIPRAGWKDIFWRVWQAIGDDRVGLVAAGATFYLLLSMFPALAAFVSLFGFFADPATIAEQVSRLSSVLPAGGLELIQSQLNAMVAQNRSFLSFGFIWGLALALWSANNGIKTLFEAMNVANGETEKRSFLRLNAVSFLFTIGAMLVATAFIVVIGVVPAILAFPWIDGWIEAMLRIARWPALLVFAFAAIILIYRYGPSRRRAKWRWLWPGAIVATLVWLAASVGFSFYLENFADYNATYGSLGAAIGLMMWMWISVYILIVGAELNSEIEHQTTCDSTVGAYAPMGDRGAVMADSLGPTADEISNSRSGKPTPRERQRAAGQPEMPSAARTGGGKGLATLMWAALVGGALMLARKSK